MSDAEDDKDVLAAEYVLGTLDADDRANAHMLMAIDPDFAASIVRWERRLGELHALVDSVDPPPSNWEWIKARIATAPQAPKLWMPGLEEAAAAAARSAPADAAPANAAPADMPPAPAVPAAPGVDAALVDRNTVLARRVGRWRSAAAAATALAAGIAGLAVLRDVRPEMFPAALRPEPVIVERPVEVIREVVREVPSQQMAEFVAVFPRDDSLPGPAFLMTVDVERRTVSVRRVDAERPADRTYELWIATQQQPQPRSLGLVEDEPFTVRQALADYDALTLANATFGISLEPPGGSPTGQPTGPVIHGRLIQATPPAFPAQTP